MSALHFLLAHLLLLAGRLSVSPAAWYRWTLALLAIAGGALAIATWILGATALGYLLF